MNWPRFTGDVRVGFEVTSSTEAWASTPPRGLSFGSDTLRIWRAGHILDSIEFRELGVQERVVAVDQLEHATIFAGDVGEDHLGLAAHCPARLAVELDPAPGFPPALRTARVLMVNPSTSRTWSH